MVTINSSIVKKVFKKIKEYPEIIIARHVGPDPDAIASTIALRDSIRLTFPEKEVYAVGLGVSKFKYYGILDKIDNEQYKNALLRTIFIIPILFLLCFLVTFILCDGIVDINYTFTHAMPGISLPSLVYLEHPLLFSFVYLVNFVLLEILCLNIGFLCVKKAKNFVLAIIMSLLIYFLLNIVCSVLIGTILFELILGIENATTYVSFYNLISYEAPIYHATIFGLLYMVLFMIIIVFISTIILYFSYRNAEKVMIEIEK